MTNDIYLLLGSNLGDRKKILERAGNLIKNHLGEVIKSSGIYETAPWGKSDQPPFLNQVVALNSALEPKQLLVEIQKIEHLLGRERKEKWGERKIDIDILYFNKLIRCTSGLIIPHPEIQNRRFTLVPLVEIAPDFIHPLLKKTNQELLDKCQDLLAVRRFKT